MFAARFYILFLLLLVTGIESVQAQISYQVSNYSATDAGAGNQNWGITTEGDEGVYIANNNGLLVFKNSTFTLHELSGSTVFRSVAFIDSTIYTGSFEDFGYWEENQPGSLEYHSLANRLENPDLNNDEIWQIVEHHNKIYFHSFGSIYCFDRTNDRVYRIETPGSLMLLHKAGDEIYTQRVREGLFRLENDELIPIAGSDFLREEEISSVIELTDETILIGTSEGIYTCLLYTSPSPRDQRGSRMPSSA